MVLESSNDLRDREQHAAVSHRQSPARLLAGPGTGKTWTLTSRVIDLVQSPNVLATAIVALTFTRAAAQELRNRVRNAIGAGTVAPYVATLHSFALQQLIQNGDQIQALPQPIRVADDWEERYIIRPDLGSILGIGVREVDDLLRDLAADWARLDADQTGWEQQFPNPEFLGAWEAHRSGYGYTLRAELVYQLKRAFDQDPDFASGAQPSHLLVDEFQDLNPCDLAVIYHLADRGAELFVAGDDDQSIYGFRHALPQAIRDFVGDRTAADLSLSVCSRCDPEILRFADWLIRQEVGRVRKTIRPEDGKAPGSVELHRFADQFAEARWIAQTCEVLSQTGTGLGEILILLRGDRKGVFSSVLVEALQALNLPVHVDVGGEGPLDTNNGRRLLSLLRLAVEPSDSLALRTLMILDSQNRLGKTAARAVEALASNRGVRFAEALRTNSENASLGRFSNSAREWLGNVDRDSTAYANFFDMSIVPPDDRLREFLSRLENLPIPGDLTNSEELSEALDELLRIQAASNADDLTELIRSIGVTLDEEERVADPDAVNILSMHKAKGLGREVVFIVAVEDETLPGRAANQPGIDEERRLLYVSATRARHRLIMTYVRRRERAQARTGRTNSAPRTLSRFLRNGYLHTEMH